LLRRTLSAAGKEVARELLKIRPDLSLTASETLIRKHDW